MCFHCTLQAGTFQGMSLESPQWDQLFSFIFTPNVPEGHCWDQHKPIVAQKGIWLIQQLNCFSDCSTAHIVSLYFLFYLLIFFFSCTVYCVQKSSTLLFFKVLVCLVDRGTVMELVFIVVFVVVILVMWWPLCFTSHNRPHCWQHLEVLEFNL